MYIKVFLLGKCLDNFKTNLIKSFKFNNVSVNIKINKRMFFFCKLKKHRHILLIVVC